MRKIILSKMLSTVRFRDVMNNAWKWDRDIKGKCPSSSSSCRSSLRICLCLPSSRRGGRVDEQVRGHRYWDCSALWPSPQSTAAVSGGWRASCGRSHGPRWEEERDKLGTHTHGCWQAPSSQVGWSVCGVSQLTTSSRSVQKLIFMVLQLWW